jgi:uncharacterized membrane protein (DUF485 family)
VVAEVDSPVDLEIQDTIKEDMDTIKDLATMNNMYIIITTIINLTINLPLVNQENLHLVAVPVAAVPVAAVPVAAVLAVVVLVAAVVVVLVAVVHAVVDEVAAVDVAEHSTNSIQVEYYVF